MKQSKVTRNSLTDNQEPKKRLDTVLFNLRKAYKSCSPTGASLNLNSNTRSLDDELRHIRSLSKENDLHLENLQKRMKESSPLVQYREVRKSDITNNQSTQKFRAKSGLAEHKRYIRGKYIETTQSSTNSKNEISSFDHIYSKIENFSVPIRKIYADVNLYKNCKRHIDTLSEFIKNRERIKTVEDLASMRYYDKRINEHCRIDSIRLKQERTLRRI